MHRSLALTFALALDALAQTGRVHGTVVDARGGEALAEVSIRLTAEYKATSDAAGHFEINAIPPGTYTLNASTVGYHAVKQTFDLSSAEMKEFAIVLSPDSFRRTDTVEVSAGPFETARQDSPSTLVLAGNDVKNLASVLADDPLRAVQSLPGVSSNNDFDARFSLRGADYNRIGLYLDNVLLHAPFHMLAGQSVTGSGAAFNGDMVDQLELHEGAFPERFEDRSAGALDVHTRDGSRTGNTFRVEASLSNAGVVAEGPLGKNKRGSWLVGARKSYLQYLISRIAPSDGTSLIFGLEDVQGRFTYDLTPKNNVTLYLLESFSSLDRARAPNLGINSLATAGYDYTLANFGWKYTSAANFALVTHTAWMREKFDNLNPNALRLANGYYGEWVANTIGSWNRSGAASLDFGVSARRIRDGGFSAQYQSVATSPRLLDHFDGTATLAGAFAQQSWTGWSGRIHLEAGVRGDRHSIDKISVASPQASAALILTPSTRIQLGWGQYAQYPELSLLTSPLGSRGLSPIRSNHALAALEQRLGARTRLRAELYNRADRDLTFQPLYDPRIVGGKVFVPPLNPAYLNSLRGYSRGAEVFIQRSSANRFTGWVSYAFGHTNLRDGVTGSRFPSDFDQRHTANLYASYRLRPSVNLSVHSSYGSGFPVPGYLALSGSQYFLSTERNRIRLDYYQRTDIRINKSWTRDKWKLTLYGEVLNLTNRTNYLFDSVNGYNTKTGQTGISLDKMFPVLPSAGILFER